MKMNLSLHSNPMHLLRLAGACVVAALAGCAATPPAPNTADQSGSAPAVTPASTARPAPPPLMLATSGGESGKDAAGQPTDALEPDRTLNLDDATARQDLWYRVRRGFAMPDLDNELVRQHEQWYATRPDYVQRMTERGGRYLFHIVEEVERRKMPSELALLPFIESAFNPRAMSTAKASGMWQFIPSTGKDYDLTQNLFRDDRRDVLASTRAALDYLQRLHNMFGDWQLALAAYNWGEGNVQRAINRNLKAGLPTDYLSLNMPAETRHYVPKLQAVKNIVASPERFSLSLPAIENHPYFVSVPIQRDIDAALAAKLAGLTLDDFHALNPSLNKPVILAAGTPQLLLPYDNAEVFLRNLEQHHGPLATWTAWVVPKTMHPSDAAKQVGMTESDLREVNRIPPRMLLKSGSTLLVPRTLARSSDVPEPIADNAMMSLAPDVPPMRRMVISAGKGDTVARIAKRYRTTPAQVAQWNHMGTQARLSKGQKIVVYVPAKQARSTQMAAKSSKNGKVAQASSSGSAKSAKGKQATRVAAKAPRGKGSPSKVKASSSRVASAGSNVR